MAELSIILVNWNCLDFTEQCIASIQSVITDLDYEVIVVDNASGDAPCLSLKEKFPWVRLILSEENVGFGRGNNLGVKESSGEYLFILNPDTVLRRGAVESMLEILKSRPEIGAVGCRLLNSDGTVQLSSVQTFPTIANQFLAIESLQRRFPHWSLWGKRPLYIRSAAGIDEVDVVSGAALMIKRNGFDRVGGFNRTYFMYAEEVELCHALRLVGLKVLHCSEAEIIHLGGQATKKCENGFVEAAMRDSVYRFLLQTRGKVYASLYRLSMVAGAGFRLIMLLLFSPATILMGFPIRRERFTQIFGKWWRIARWGLTSEAAPYNFHRVNKQEILIE